MKHENATDNTEQNAQSTGQQQHQGQKKQEGHAGKTGPSIGKSTGSPNQTSRSMKSMNVSRPGDNPLSLVVGWTT